MFSEEPITRREFLKQLVRCTAAGLLALGLGSLVARPGKACDIPQACYLCDELPRCDRPEAREARRRKP